MTQALSCPRCGGNLRFQDGDSKTVCEYCGAQIVARAAPEPASSGSTGALARSIAIKVTEEIVLPLIAAGTALPASHRETIASQRDGQESVTATLVSESPGTLALREPLVEVTLELTSRKARSLPVAQLSIEVTADGTVNVELREEGTTRTVRGRGFLPS